MTVEEQIHEMGVKARAAATALRAFTTAQKNAALTAIADALDAAKPQIDAANAEDVAAAQANGLAPALVDRLTLLPVTLRFPLDRRLGSFLPVAIERLSYPFPFRTRKSRASSPRVLRDSPAGE